MKIGNIEITGAAVLAPLAGITDLPFRLLCKEQGAALVYTEMISAEGLIRRQGAALRITESAPEERPVAFQLFGGRPEAMAGAAGMLAGLGADIVDINMGCPVRKVVSGGAGAALLKDIKAAALVVKSVVAATPLPVTVKLRTGPTGSDFVAADMAKAAREAGAAAVAVHGRHAGQGFSGDADWSAIRAVKEAVGIPVIGNGDVRSAQDAGRMLDETGCDLVMIGRGALGNPWIFREVNSFLTAGEVPPPPSRAEKGGMLLRHLRAVVAREGELHGVRMMRKHAAWYCRGEDGGAGFRRKVNAETTMAGFEEAVREFFGPP